MKVPYSWCLITQRTVRAGSAWFLSKCKTLLHPNVTSSEVCRKDSGAWAGLTVPDKFERYILYTVTVKLVSFGTLVRTVSLWHSSTESQLLGWHSPWQVFSTVFISWKDCENFHPFLNRMLFLSLPYRIIPLLELQIPLPQVSVQFWEKMGQLWFAFQAASRREKWDILKQKCNLAIGQSNACTSFTRDEVYYRHWVIVKAFVSSHTVTRRTVSCNGSVLDCYYKLLWLKYHPSKSEKHPTCGLFALKYGLPYCLGCQIVYCYSHLP